MNPSRVIADLKQLRALTGDENGAQRVAFTRGWVQARDFLKEKLSGLPVETHEDAAGNLWTTLAGQSKKSLLIGGHMDSVPDGGWLDGCLNTLAGVEILRRISGQYEGCPPATVRLVDWADEEGARFGRSLFGSSACAGWLDLGETRGLRDRDGVSLPDALRVVGLDFENILDSRRELAHAAAYIELHIEQGPVLLDAGHALGSVLGTFGVERHAVSFTGQAAHSGSTPMNRRHDAFLAAAKMAPEIYRIAERHGGVCTIGSCTTEPGIATSVVAGCRIALDQRHIEASALAAMLADARAAADRFAAEGGVAAAWQPLCRIDPLLFDEDLVSLCDEAILEICGATLRMPSGPLHDASAIARAGVPAAMMFVQSLHGISHNRIEDTKEEHLDAAIRAFDRLASKALARLS
ncbi:MAG: hydantoinase/carbamoylase family amidase [Verrucomicrobiae bacterium]